MAVPGRSLRRVGLLATPSLAVLATIVGMTAGGIDARGDAPAQQPACQGDNGGLTLSPGFCATIFADNLGHVRHLVVAPDGMLYANTWSGRYFPNAPPPPGGFLIALKDTTGGGRADVVQRFGVTVEAGGTGGSGIALYQDALFAEENGRILRYPLAPGTALPIGPPTVVLSGLPLTGDHPMHPFVIDSKGRLFVDLGSATNSCQFQNRIPNSPGHNPCTEKETRAGTWRYDANKTGQVFSPRGTLRKRTAQWRGLRLRRRRPPVRDPARSRSTLSELAAILYGGAERGTAGRGVGPARSRRRLWLARVLL